MPCGIVPGSLFLLRSSRLIVGVLFWESTLVKVSKGCLLMKFL